MVATPTTKAALAAKARGVMLGGTELAKARELFVASIKPLPVFLTLSSPAACSVGVAGGQTRLQMIAFSNVLHRLLHWAHAASRRTTEAPPRQQSGRGRISEHSRHAAPLHRRICLSAAFSPSSRLLDLKGAVQQVQGQQDQRDHRHQREAILFIGSMRMRFSAHREGVRHICEAGIILCVRRRLPSANRACHE